MTFTLTYDWHEIRRGLKVLAGHYSHALLGIGCRLDPDERRPTGGAWGLVGLLGFLGPHPLYIGTLFLVLSPMWLYAVVLLEDRIIEHRGYWSLLGVALIAGWAWEQAPWAVSALLILWACRFLERARYFRSELDFRRQAARESPDKMRARGMYGNALLETGRCEEALSEYGVVHRYGSPEEREMAARNIRRC